MAAEEQFGPPPEAIAHAHEDRFSPREGPVERACRRVCELAILVMMVMVGTELLTRSLLRFSFQVNTELGGYILLGITFLSLCVGQARHTFHRVQFLDSRLTPRAQAALRLVFDTLACLVVVVLVWQFIRLEVQSWNSGEVASTNLLTPLWLPRALMPLGALALLWTMVRTIVGDARRLHALFSVAPRRRAPR